MTAQGHGALFDKLSLTFRSRRNRFLKKLLLNCKNAKPVSDKPFKVLDLGGTSEYWKSVGFDFIELNNIHITCVNYSKSELSDTDHKFISKIVADARSMPQFSDHEFDFVHSNSVIEHVGSFDDMMQFAAEVKRLAPNFYIQTPYFWFPIDPHFPRMPFFHWMPHSVQLRVIGNFKIGWSRPIKDTAHAMKVLNGTQILDRRQFRYLFPDASHKFEWFLLPKSMIAFRFLSS